MAKDTPAKATSGKNTTVKTPRKDPLDLYNQWLYPEPITDLQAYHDTGRIDAAAPKAVHLLYWPDGRYLTGEGRKIDILVAGCGPNAAARYAFEHPEASVLGVDVSTSALKHEAYLKDKHNLTNLTLHEARVEDLGKLDRQFDFIEAVGVMNHFADPLKALKAMKKTLKPDGVITAMVFGMYARAGTYMLQKLFMGLGLEPSKEEVETVRQTLGILHPDHPGTQFFRNNIDLQYNAGIVDAFLRNVDRIYNVEACLQFATDLDMQFAGWLDNFYYYPDGQIPLEHPLYARIQSLPDEKKWQMMELFNGTISKHNFILCHKERDPASYRPNFDGEGFFDYVPFLRINRFEPPNRQQNTQAMIQRFPFAPVPLTDLQLALLAQVNGERTILECVEAANLQGKPEVIEKVARNFFRSLWQISYVLFRFPAA